jgi:1,4-alpha-glucan branching enzyme
MNELLLNPNDLYLFNNGTLEQTWRLLGANHAVHNGERGVMFAVWAPNATQVALVGDHNHWDGRVDLMAPQGHSGVWAIFKTDVVAGTRYKYEIHDQYGHLLPLKADPYAQQMECPSATASLVPKLSTHQWQDASWLAQRAATPSHQQALSIYEVHLGSWRRHDAWRALSYRELAAELLPYVKDLGFTHVQLMPISEFPFDGSWGYQPLGMYAPTARFGEPDDFKFFIDTAHQLGLGVLLDWVPGHFPSDPHGLANFDGTHLYEHADPRQGFHPDWNTCIYNYDRAEVQSYLLSNALYWLDEFHIDGLRFDAVASMLYLDYSRNHGEWIPNPHGGRENLGALHVLRCVNQRAYRQHPGVLMVAEESTAWPGVTKFIEHGGLGFGYKWNMGWMNDSLRYLARDPVYRKFHHNEMTFSLLYAFSENFILPLSHDEVVHGKRSIIERVPGDDWQKFATVRCYLSFMWMHPGKKLLFMGIEFAQRAEWNHDQALDWHLLQYAPHQGVQSVVRDLNRLYQQQGALHELDQAPQGFRWLNADDHQHSIFSFMRLGNAGSAPVLCVCNFTPMLHRQTRIGVPDPGWYHEILNTDALHYGGTGHGNLGGVAAEPIPMHGQPWSVNVVLPPLAALMFVRAEGTSQEGAS